MTEAQIRAALDEIADPCSVAAGAPAGIVAMGLVRQLAITEAPGGVAVALRIGVTEPGCMMGASFAIRAREALEALPEVVAVDVELDHANDWLPGDLDPAYAQRLERVRAATRQRLRAS
jgi:metal-sulfur cluster biosynthetic enzyme